MWRLILPRLIPSVCLRISLDWGFLPPVILVASLLPEFMSLRLMLLPLFCRGRGLAGLGLCCYLLIPMRIFRLTMR